MVSKDKGVAKNLLRYRYLQLEKAIENAEKLGFNSGAALYPMVTVNGEECNNEWEITFEEIHRNSAIAFAIKKYIDYTNDQAHMAEMGLEVLIGISRFWAQRVSFSTHLNQYVILGVTGPNEYENNVDNNWYTNYSARWCLQYTQKALEQMSIEAPENYHRICQKTNFNFNEIEQWEKIIKSMYLPYSEKLGLYLQNDGFLNKELIPASEIPKEQRPINQHWSWDRILRSPYIKQADLLQGFYFFEDDFSKEELKKHYDFYETFTSQLKTPLTLFYDDFDNNGSIDPILCITQNNEYYPYWSKDDLLSQLNSLKSKYVSYASYASEPLKNILNENQLREAQKIEVNTFASSILLNMGNDEFEWSSLPTSIQMAPLYGITVFDADQDGKQDLIVGGNLFGTRARFGRFDASKGEFLKGKGDGTFEVVSYAKSGLKIEGEVRDIVPIQLNQKPHFLIGRNNNSIKIFAIRD